VAARAPTYDDYVFLNCPFDREYEPIFHALLFAIHDAGFFARCALEISDSAQNRLEKIMGIIGECRYGVHDLSRTELNEHGLPRFNMPLELGIFLGAKRFGGKREKRKGGLILDRDPYRYQRFISDISGQDISTHRGDPKRAVARVRDWLKTASRRTRIPGGTAIYERYRRFEAQLPEMCAAIPIRPEELTFVDRTQLVSQWLALNAP
jgi:hypothetical protein